MIRYRTKDGKLARTNDILYDPDCGEMLIRDNIGTSFTVFGFASRFVEDDSIAEFLYACFIVYLGDHPDPTQRY